MKSVFLLSAITLLSACLDPVAALTEETNPAAAVVVDPAALAAPAAGPDGGTAVVMPEAKVSGAAGVGTAAAPKADVNPAVTSDAHKAH